MDGRGRPLGLFLSIVFHEFWHSVIARHFGLPMKGITLFIFGGVAEMEDEPPNAKTELLMAIAGPISSAVLGGLFSGGLPGRQCRPLARAGLGRPAIPRLAEPGAGRLQS